VKEEKKKGWAGWAGLQGKRKDKGPGPIRKKEGEKELHSNAFGFEFKI
jgi:hypothetical protein